MQPKKPGQERLAWVPEQILRGSCGFITTPGCSSSKAPVPLPRLRGPRNQVASGQRPAGRHGAYALRAVPARPLEQEQLGLGAQHQCGPGCRQGEDECPRHRAREK